MMRAISLWQPHATGVALGLKTIETRGRLTHVRGDLAIHAANKTFELIEWPKLLCSSLMSKADQVPGFHSSVSELLLDLPHACVVAVVDLWECWPTEHLVNLRQPLTSVELAWGDYSSGRYGWAFRNLRKLKEPVPCKGKQGFFFLSDDVEAKVRAQL